VRARRTVVVFIITFVALTAGFSFAADTFTPTLRDPEYGKKLTRLTARTAAHPGRPVVAVFGSSRVGMGIRPSAVEAAFDPGHRPVVANLSLVGSGPLMQLLVFERVRRARFRPDAIVVEFWPALGRNGDADREENRIDPVRLFPGDRDLVRSYFRHPGAVERRMRAARWNPWTASRARLIGLTFPGWLPAGMRADAGWAALDPEGWSAGLTDKDVAAVRHNDMDRSYYGPRLKDTTVSDVSDQALHDFAARCRADGIPLAFVWLPESTRFRELYSPQTEAAVTGYWHRLIADCGVPGIDCRKAMTDDCLPDGFHLTQSGAAEFGPIFADELRRAFPRLGRRE
jgi:hypothetical protein